MTEDTDPLAAIAAPPPALSAARAIEIAAEQYRLDVEVCSLVSERDQNFQMCDADGKQYVLKIANQAEDPAVTRFQIDALVHLDEYVRARGAPISAPTVIRTRDGDAFTTIKIGAATHMARVVTYVEGSPLGERLPSTKLCRSMGVYLAHLGLALRDFRHCGSQQDLLWDIQQSLRLRALLKHLPAEDMYASVVESLDDFERYVTPVLSSLRRQVIHSDFNPDNVLVGRTENHAVVGVIDFGDMLEAPLIADVAIAAAYLRPDSGDPLALIAELIAGYAGVTPLLPEEIDVLFDIVRARLCASITLLHWRASFRDAGDPYLGKVLAAESTAATFLQRLTALPREHVLQVFRQVCAAMR